MFYHFIPFKGQVRDRRNSPMRIITDWDSHNSNTGVLEAKASRHHEIFVALNTGQYAYR